MSDKRPTIDYAPGLDGIRGFCLIGVLLFHAPFSWMSGGFLGVSTFFTLSGYLITTLLLAEVESSGRVDFAAFWERRMRRLGPPLWIGVAATVFTAAWWIPPAARERLGLDALSSLLFVSNWRFMTPEYAYSRLFTDPSSLQHCWSLAIEAQYYLLFPLLVVPVLRRYGLAGAAVAVVSLLALSVAAGLASVSTYRIYYGTHTRAAEILAGALMAVALRGGVLRAGGHGRMADAAAGVALVAIVATWAMTEVDSNWLYVGGLPAYAALSGVLIFCALSPGALINQFLCLEPLRWIGRISYGAYVYHWPIFLLLSSERTNLGPVPLFAVRVALTLALAEISYRWAEQPVRVRRFLVSRRSLAGLAMSSTLLVFGFAVALHWEEWRAWGVGITREIGTDHRAGEEHLRRVSLFGDSTAFELSGMLRFWGGAYGFTYVGGRPEIGCSLIDRGTVRTWMGEHNLREKCAGWVPSWEEDIAEHKPDLALVLVGPWEVRDRRLPGHSRFRAMGDPIFDAEFRIAVEQVLRLMRKHGVKVAWLTFPRLQFAAVRHGEEHQSEIDASNPARIRRMNEILAQVAAEHPDQMRIIDFAAHLEQRPESVLDPDLRPDGVHFGRGFRNPLAKWITEELDRVARELLGGDAAGRSGASLTPVSRQRVRPVPGPGVSRHWRPAPSASSLCHRGRSTPSSG